MIWENASSPEERAIQLQLKSHPSLPKHVAIIMDGNGRWAVSKGLSRLSGHRQGTESVRRIVRAASNCGIRFLTVYAFSLENWKRPHAEVNALMQLLESFLKTEIDELHNNNVRVNTIGKTNALPKSVQKLLRNAIEKTKNNVGMTFTIALSYSSRWDIVRATQMISLDVRRGKLSPEDITDVTFSSYLGTGNLPEPDLLIRTSGEFRISNFMLWELAYSEIFVSDTNWPDFSNEEFYVALNSYMKRERRFGMTSAQVSSDEVKQVNHLPKSNPRTFLSRVLNVFQK